MSRLIATCRPLLSLSLLTLIGVSALTGCRPELDEDTGVRLGIVGEFCQADASCREDLVCNNSQCVDLNGGDPSTCATMCDRLVNVCGRDEPNCTRRCELTVEGWSEQALTIFENCTLGMSTPELTCEEAQKPKAPDFCYAQIPLDPQRVERCDAFVTRARAAASLGADDASLESLRTRCYVIARTRPETNPADPAQSWANTQACAATDLSDSELITCLNDTFKVSPALPE